MRVVIAIFLIASAYSTKGQVFENLNCMLLEQIMETPVFNSEFSFAENLNEEFVLVDTSRVYLGCPENTFKEGRVKITNVMPTKKEMVNSKNILIASVGEKKDCFISFGFWSPGTERYLTIHYEIEKEGYKLLGYKLGIL